MTDDAVTDLPLSAKEKRLISQLREDAFKQWQKRKIKDQWTELRRTVADGDLSSVESILEARDLPAKGKSLLLKQTDDDCRTPVLLAASKGHLPLLQFLVGRCGADLDAVDKDGRSALSLAAGFGDVAACRYVLVSNPELLNAKDNSGRSPVLRAAQGRNLVNLLYLVEGCGANLDEVDKTGNTALHLAAAFGSVALCEYLLSKRRRWLNVANTRFGGTPVLAAAEAGKLENLRYLVRRRRANLDEVDNNGSTALHLAAKYGNIATCEYLLSKRQDWLNAKNTRSGVTPVLAAAEGGNLDNLAYLVDECCADLDEVDNCGNTALMLAAKFGNVGTCKYLLSQRPDWLNMQNTDFGGTPVLSAAEGGKVENLKYLAEECSADLDEVDNNGATALHLAAKYSNEATCEYLLSKRPLWLNVVDSGFGRSPILYAAVGGNIKTFKFLLSSGGDMTLVDSRGHNCLTLAAYFGHSEIVKAFCANYEAYKQQEGSKKRKRTAIRLAHRQGKKSIVHFLQDLEVD